MKKDIHPECGPVVVTDTAVGVTYPEVRVDVSSASHPFWTGTTRVMDTAGQVEKFRRRHGERRRP